MICVDSRVIGTCVTGNDGNGNKEQRYVGREN